jgi:hypothetical protein
MGVGSSPMAMAISSQALRRAQCMQSFTTLSRKV